MLKRIRIEVEGESAAGVLAELDKYEHALQAAEAERFGLGLDHDPTDRPYERFENWGVSVHERHYFNEQLGREVTDEVIAFEPDGPNWVGRRVAVYRRLDLRALSSVVPEPRVVDHWEDRTTYPGDLDEANDVDVDRSGHRSG